MNAFVRSIMGFGAFCFAMALTVDRFGLGAGLAAALAAQFAVSGGILAYTRPHTAAWLNGVRSQ